MREIVHIQVGQCGNQIGAKVKFIFLSFLRTVMLQIFLHCQIFQLSVTPVPLVDTPLFTPITVYSYADFIFAIVF